MIKIVKQIEEPVVITFKDIDKYIEFNYIFVYKSKNSDNYCLLSKVGSHTYGIVPIGFNNSDARYTASTRQSAIYNVLSAGRDIRMFKSLEEFCKVIINKEF